MVKQDYYKGFILMIEESGNVSIFSLQGFIDKLANMSEAKARIDDIYSKQFSKGA